MEMIAVLFFAFVSCQAVPVLITNGIAETGVSSQYKTEDNHGNYAFGYTEDHSSGGSFRKESGDSLGNKAGSYGLHDADGRARVVNYVADAAGFRADVHTNEPGVDPSQDPAHVAVNKPSVIVAPVVQKAVVAPAVALASHHHVALAYLHHFHTPMMSVLMPGGHLVL